MCFCLGYFLIYGRSRYHEVVIPAQNGQFYGAEVPLHPFQWENQMFHCFRGFFSHFYCKQAFQTWKDENIC